MPTDQEAQRRRHSDVKQSWSWTQQPNEEHTRSPQAKMRLAWLRWHREHGATINRTCHHFALGRRVPHRVLHGRVS